MNLHMIDDTDLKSMEITDRHHKALILQHAQLTAQKMKSETDYCIIEKGLFLFFFLVFLFIYY